MEKVSKIGKICLRIITFCLTLVYPGFMAMMSAAGWMHNVGTGSYPAIFRSYAGWMFAGGGLLCAGMVLALFGIRGKWWKCNVAGAAASVTGCIACMTVLQKFSAYADEHFPGIGDSMKPVSELYRERLLPIAGVAVLLVLLCVWQALAEPAREYRIRKFREKQAKENAPAPKILS